MKYIFHEPAAYCRWRKCLLVMKLTLILLIAFVLHAGARGTAQTVTLSVKDMPLEKVCKEIERQTGYYFVYTEDINKEGRLISVSVTNADITETLRRVFEGLLFSYQIIDKVVVVNTVNKIMSQPTTIDSSDQMVKIEGVVLNEQRQPLDGATIMVKSNGKTTLTNNRGQFSLSNISPNSVLVVSYIGYATKMIVAKKNEHLEIIMSLAANALDETVIKGYYATTNRLNTGNVSVVKGVDIQKQPVTDPLLALEGRVPGLYIEQTSGIPGAYSSIFLRGQNSIFNADVKLGTVNDPLFIIDGIPYSTQSLTNDYFGGGAVGTPGTRAASRGSGLSPFNNINTADIERIEVLKDADATAIYGSRGANGVILITTKKGKAGVTKFDVNIFTGGGKATRKLPLLNTQQYLAMRREALRNDGLSVGIEDYDLNGDWDTTRYTDWQKLLIGNMAKFSSAQLNISGGNANTQFVVSGGYSTQGTLYPGNYRDNKSSGSVSITHMSSNRRFNANAGARYVYDNNNLPQVDLGGKIALAPDAPPLYDANGNLNWQVQNETSTFSNPLSYIKQSAIANSNTLISNLSINYKLFPSIEFRNNVGYTRSEMNQIMLSPSAALPPPLNLDPYQRSSYFSTTDMQTAIVEPQISFRQNIGKGILDILVGSTIQQSHNHSIATGGVGYVSDELLQNPLNASVFALLENSYSDYRYNALYGRISYSWLNKYLINITGRRDGSSRFGPSKQFGNFGAIGAGWIFSAEPFFEKSLSFISFGKLRVSYGTAGNDGIQDYQYLSSYISNPSTYQGITALAPARIPNPYFAWESVKKLEGGLEVGFLKDRMMFTISYYRNRSGNQLTGYPLPNISGFNLVQENLPAIVENSGLEFTLNGLLVKTNNFNWNLTANLSIPRNKLIAFPNLEKTSLRFYYVVGKSLFINNVAHSIGIDSKTGLYTFATKSGSGIPAMEDLIPIEQSQHLYGGVQNTFTYKGWALDVFLQIVKQTRSSYQAAFTTPGYFVYYSPTQNQPVWVLDRWQSNSQHAMVQKFSTSTAAQNAYNSLISSDMSISDASFIRIKNVALSYQFSTAWLKTMYMQSARLYLQCQNLFTITKYRGIDPETGGIGLPPLRMITAGIQFSL